MPSKSFDSAEVEALGTALRKGSQLVCPRCDVPLDRRAVLPRPEVSYVRDRIWLVCPSCHRTAVLDRRDGR